MHARTDGFFELGGAARDGGAGRIQPEHASTSILFFPHPLASAAVLDEDGRTTPAKHGTKYAVEDLLAVAEDSYRQHELGEEGQPDQYTENKEDHIPQEGDPVPQDDGQPVPQPEVHHPTDENPEEEVHPGSLIEARLVHYV
jgi:hypothetical protein